MSSSKRIACGLAVATALAFAWAASARGGGYSWSGMAAPEGAARAGSPFRWQALPIGRRRPATVLERISRRGGVATAVLTLPGRWQIEAPAADGEGAGLSADERVLVLVRPGKADPDGVRRRTHLAIIRPFRAGKKQPGRPFRVRRVGLAGDYTVDGISPDGATVYLVHTLYFSRRLAESRFTLVPYEVRGAHRLLPAAALRGNGEILAGSPVARIQDAPGRHVYTLYVESRGGMFLLGLDTVDNSEAKLELPRLRHFRNPFALDLRLDPGGRDLTIRRHSSRHRGRRQTPVLRIDLGRMHWPPTASTDPVGVFSRTVGHSAEGRPIELHEVGDLALPGRLLVFGCVHGDECGGSALEPLGIGGCPDGLQHAYVVPNLDPDGSARRSRLNGRGVDLNRNFAAGWRGGGAPGDPEYPGPHPFSEPETRLAARLVRTLRPRVTIWFHQHWGAGRYVRSWGPSAPAARRFARLAGLGFRRMPWPAGTAPNWQNHRFPGTASFVVELPRGKLPQPLQIRLDRALGRLGEEVGEDPRVARKG